MRRNLTSLLDDLAASPDRPAFALRSSYRTLRWTAGRARSVALSAAARLSGAVRPGESVVLQGPNSPEWCAALLGIAARGAVAVPLDAGSSDAFARGVARRVGARAAIVSAERADLFAGEGVPVITFEELASDSVSAAPAAPEIHDAAPEDTAEIVFTSGTTAEPRGVELSHANLLSAVERIERGFVRREWYLRPLLPMRLMCLVPLSHLFGQTLGLFIPVVMKSTAVFTDSIRSSRLVRAIRAERPLAVTTVPHTLAAIRHAVERELDRRGRRARFELRRGRASSRSAWRRALATRDVRAVLGWHTWALVVGGAALDPDLEDFWTGCGYAVIQGYGMTEAAPVVAVHNPLGGRRHSIGKPVRGVEVRLAEDGELWIRGPNVMKGYHGDPAATREVLRDGWLRTGDLAERDEHGRLYYRGRKKDVIVTSGGMNVFPRDIEGVLESFADVRGAVAYGVRGEGGDEVHATVLAARPGVDLDELRARANDRLEPHQRVRRLEMWGGDDFPRTPTGKVVRREVARAAGQRARATPPAAEASRARRVFDRLRRSLASGSEVDRDERLDLDSLDRLELLGLIEEAYGVAVSDGDAGGELTVGRVEQWVAGETTPAKRITMPRWTRRVAARWTRAVLQATVVAAALRAFVRLRVEGVERLETLRGSYLLAANHTSVLDVPAILFALPRSARRRLCPAMAIETLPEHFEPGLAHPWRRLWSSSWYTLAVWIFAAYPLPQSRGYRPSLEYTAELLDAGLLPLVFPEGHMTLTGRMATFKSGIGLLALETRAPVVPVRVEGLASILPPRSRRPRRGTARVVIGEPLTSLERTATSAEEAARLIEDAVRRLAPEDDAR